MQLWTSLQNQNRFELARAERSLTITSEYLDRPRRLNVAQIIKDKNEIVSLQDLWYYRGEEYYRAVVTTLITSVAQFFAVGNSMNDRMIEMLCRMIYEKYPRWKVDDLALALDMGMKGDFGPLYNRLDGGVIMEWLGKYDDVRYNEIAQYREQENNEQKAESKLYDPQVAKAIIEGFKMVEKREKKKRYTWTSIEQYCFANNLDYDDYITPLVEKWNNEYVATDRIPPEMWVDYMKSCHLHELNNCRNG